MYTCLSIYTCMDISISLYNPDLKLPPTDPPQVIIYIYVHLFIPLFIYMHIFLHIYTCRYIYTNMDVVSLFITRTCAVRPRTRRRHIVTMHYTSVCIEGYLSVYINLPVDLYMNGCLYLCITPT